MVTKFKRCRRWSWKDKRCLCKLMSPSFLVPRGKSHWTQLLTRTSKSASFSMHTARSLCSNRLRRTR